MMRSSCTQIQDQNVQRTVSKIPGVEKINHGKCNLFILLLSEPTVSYLLFFKSPIPPPYLPFQPSFPVFLRNGSDQKRTFTDHPHHHHHSHPLVSVPIFSHLLPVTMNEKSLALNPCGLCTRSHPFSYSKTATSSSLHHRHSHPLSRSIPIHRNHDHCGGSSYRLSPGLSPQPPNWCPFSPCSPSICTHHNSQNDSVTMQEDRVTLLLKTLQRAHISLSVQAEVPTKAFEALFGFPASSSPYHSALIYFSPWALPAPATLTISP